MKERDFTLKTYTHMVDAFFKEGYEFQTVESFIENPKSKVAVLRHDVDLRNHAASRLAEIEAKMGIKSTYYFRVVRQSYDPKVIKRIVSMGHEIGYHYEDLASCKGDYDKSIRSFEKNLVMFRKLYPVKTICMHGSSGSPFDNRDLWKRYRLEDFGLICEPYLSIDYNKVLYLSDTGRCWNASKMSVRDRVETKYEYSFKVTQDIINAIDTLPNSVLITAHPEQWTDNLPEWLYVRAFSLAHTFYKVHYRNKRVIRYQA